MRLICPNCDAQYEVPDDVMPPEGRDVQCSNCGQTWYQEHPDTVAREQNEAKSAPDEDEEVVQEDALPPAPEQPPVDVAPKAPDVPTFDRDEEITTKPIREPGRKSLDPAVADVLREEAELEKRARRNEGLSGLESQPDLGLGTEPQDNPERRLVQARERMARLRGEEPVPDDLDAPMSSDSVLTSRRDLLPDIEEINSTLRSNNDRSPANDPGQTAQIEVREARSSRRGFTLVVALVSVLTLIYVFADQISQMVPQAEQPLTTYVAIVDSWRLWLDERIAALLAWLDAAAASSSR
jgi:predicted Zn finger-like uncharacterized protein